MTIDYWYIPSFAKSVRDAEESGAKKKTGRAKSWGGGEARKFRDRLRSYGNTLLRSSAIVIAEDRTVFYFMVTTLFAIVCDPRSSAIF